MDAEAQLERFLEAFYEEKVEPKIAASKNILLLTMDFKNLEFLLNHGIRIYKKKFLKINSCLQFQETFVMNTRSPLNCAPSYYVASTFFQIILNSIHYYRSTSLVTQQ